MDGTPEAEPLPPFAARLVGPGDLLPADRPVLRRNEDGYKDVSGQIVQGSTQLFSPGDANNAVQTTTDIQDWETAGTQWLGGTLKGISPKSAT